MTTGAKADVSGYYFQTEDQFTRPRSLESETRDKFQKFLRTDVSKRIKDTATADRAGFFHSMVFNPDQAACKHCDYGDACDGVTTSATRCRSHWQPRGATLCPNRVGDRH